MNKRAVVTHQVIGFLTVQKNPMNRLISAVISGIISSWENVRSCNPLFSNIDIPDHKLLNPRILLPKLTPQPFRSP
ncbi:hypothetical protein MC7420_6461 [Coleofasciculus chthonoplastes PCC 7420]|uniref:Uncharacterized protein n=1 Tax=Coleofasciculus chthonoplastes PCC 7420 TaxID=118168 RepID=B4VQJ3_9CYAN|nr:hypothetical protein MC7420_6461 [Coleofasciculus chthonoplastes PCC 7420]